MSIPPVKVDTNLNVQTLATAITSSLTNISSAAVTDIALVGAAGGIYGAASASATALAAPVFDVVYTSGAVGSVATGVVATEATIAAGAGVTTAATAGAATFGLYAGLAAGGLVAFGALLGILKTILGPFRLAPSLDVSVNGLPTMKQLSVLGAISMMIGNVVQGINSIPKVLAGAATFAITLGGLLEPINADAVQKGVENTVANLGTLAADTQTVTKVNPFADVLITDIAALQFFSTATSSATIWLSGQTATSSIGGVFWNIQKDFASTASGSYQSIFYTAKYVTDGLAGVNGSTGIMSIETIIDDNRNLASYGSTATVNSLLPITPSLDSMAGTLLFPDYINSATQALSILLFDANTSTTAQWQLELDRTNLNIATQNLLQRIQADINNQTAYQSHSANVASMHSLATTVNRIRETQPSYVSSMYEATLHPNVRSNIYAVSALQNLSSNDPQTAYNAAMILALNTATIA